MRFPCECGGQLVVKVFFEIFGSLDFFDFRKIQTYYRIGFVCPELFNFQTAEVLQTVSKWRVKGGDQKRFSETAGASKKNFSSAFGQLEHQSSFVNVDFVVFTKSTERRVLKSEEPMGKACSILKSGTR